MFFESSRILWLNSTWVIHKNLTALVLGVEEVNERSSFLKSARFKHCCFSYMGTEKSFHESFLHL